MDDTACREFFTQPTQTYHRRYEALRAVFAGGRPQKEVADEFGFTYGAMRQLVLEFRRNHAAQEESTPSPFFEMFSPDVPLPMSMTSVSQIRRQRTGGNWSCRASNRCVSEQERPACFCSYRCWPSWGLTRWCARPVTPAPRWFHRMRLCSACWHSSCFAKNG